MKKEGKKGGRMEGNMERKEETYQNKGEHYLPNIYK